MMMITKIMMMMTLMMMMIKMMMVMMIRQTPPLNGHIDQRVFLMYFEWKSLINSLLH